MIAAVAVKPPSTVVAVIVAAAPVATPVTRPVALTVARAGLDVVYVTLVFEAPRCKRLDN